MMNCSKNTTGPGTHTTRFRGRLPQAEAKVLQHNTGPGNPCHQVSGPTKPSTGGSRRREGRRKEGGREGRMRRMRRRRESRLRKNQNIYQGVRKNN